MNKLKIFSVIIFGVLLVLASYLYTLNQKKISLLEKQNEIIQKQEQREKEKETKLNACLEYARISYVSRWHSHCKDLGQKEDCLLPNVTATNYERYYKEARDECYNRF
jgi:hypothetical protein